MRLVISLLLFCAPSLVAAQQFNAGFVEGLWFDSETIFAEKPVRIYAAIRNNTGSDLSGTVEFYINDKRIMRKSVSALNNRIIESWTDWTPTYGEHTVRAEITKAELSQPGSDAQTVAIVAASAKRTIFVDYDTDGDDVGNETDLDDDNDGYSDEAEIENGSDPLDPTDPITEANSPDDQSDASHDSSSSTAIDRGTESSRDDEYDGSMERNNPAGLEQYLTDSRADRVFASLTETINTSKRNIDAYRKQREADAKPDEAAVPQERGVSTTSAPVESGFGEIERTNNSEGGFLPNLISLAEKVIALTFTLLLFLISLYLTYPIVVQITLLLLILYLVYKIAKRVGSRPQ